MAKWEDFDQFDPIIKKYVEPRGEGTSMASQIVTAINKLIYMFYNNGDFYDNTYTYQFGVICNDIASYANWLYNHIALVELREIKDISSFEDDVAYLNILYKIAKKCLNEEFLEKYVDSPLSGSIYSETEPFMIDKHLLEDEDEYDYDYDDEEGDIS